MHFERREPADAAEAERFDARLENLRRTLRDRTVATELYTAIEAQRRIGVSGHSVEVRPEPPPEAEPR